MTKVEERANSGLPSLGVHHLVCIESERVGLAIAPNKVLDLWDSQLQIFPARLESRLLTDHEGIHLLS